MLQTVMGVHWSQHVASENVYQELPKLREKIRGRSLQGMAREEKGSLSLRSYYGNLDMDMNCENTIM